MQADEPHDPALSRVQRKTPQAVRDRKCSDSDARHQRSAVMNRALCQCMSASGIEHRMQALLPCDPQPAAQPAASPGGGGVCGAPFARTARSGRAFEHPTASLCLGNNSCAVHRQDVTAPDCACVTTSCFAAKRSAVLVTCTPRLRSPPCAHQPSPPGVVARTGDFRAGGGERRTAP